ncbi:MAG: biopolymer transporter ExbD [Kiritimatiellae bacterium]|nr:biopolymer transporter ExbD [Kiritimatiellia bacterium]
MGGKRRRGARLEMTSLMDVMFLVLVFFIYCIFDMAVHKGLKVDLPNAAGADEKGERIVVTIRADDTMQLNGMSMSREEVISRVKELNRVKMNLPVLISGDRRSSLGVGIELLSALKAAGVEKASFQVSGERGAGNGE